jgi:polar amino acid transport system permease protein
MVKLTIVWIIIFVILGVLFLSLGLDTDYMRQWAGYIAKGVQYTLILCFGGILLAIPLALLGALGRLSKNPIPYGVASFYVSFFRGTPLIVVSGILALGLNYGAYMSEIFRAGILSVGHGQVEAAHALAMTGPQTLRRVVLPQAVRIIVPPTGNEFIAMLKDSALLGIVGVQELLFRATQSGRAAFRTLETLIVATAIYWLLTSIFEYFQRHLERRLARGFERAVRTHGH